ncbi:hypothetical protein H0H87_010744 [Tephrocybe sp. NHM501043]|nr:hypothetical protein H0H87_010744 [Tephrocybe sp. NHM501043]
MDNSSTWISRIPTLDKLGAVITAEPDPVALAKDWFSSFARSMGNSEETIRLLSPDALWRDLLALTWDMRTFEGSPKIKAFLDERNSSGQMRALIRKDFVQLQRPYSDLLWIVGTFKFEVDIGHGSGVFRLVPTATGEWKAFTIFTNLESLANFPSAIGPLRSREVISGHTWAERLRQERSMDARDPAVATYTGETLHSSQYKRAADYRGKKVFVIGSGNSGHDIASDLARNDIGGVFVLHSTETLNKLKDAGFRVNSGIKDAGLLLQLKERAGGHYFDTGGSKLIADGKIKIKNDSAISSFIAHGIEFTNGSTIEADTVIFATG